MPPRKKRANPEAALQIRVVKMLVVRLPDDVFWTASLTGVWLPISVAIKAKAMGIRRGWTDLSFLCPDGVIRVIELKTKTGSLRPDQRKMRDLCLRSGNDIWALCRSVEDVVATLTRWGVELLPDPFERHDLPAGMGFLDGLE